MKQRIMKYRIDPNKAEISSRVLAKVLETSTRMIAHLVQITGQEAEEKPDGRGTRRKFTYRQSAGLKLGKTLSSTGMAPNRIKKCVDAVMERWGQYFPGEIVVEAKHGIWIISDADWRTTQGVLIAWEDRKGFQCDIIGWGELQDRIETLSHSATVVLGLTNAVRGFFFELCMEAVGIETKRV